MDAAIAAIDAALARGELLGAYDTTSRLLAAGNNAPRVRYLRILALARMGETEEALSELNATPTALLRDEDGLALRGRLLKDLALEAAPNRRTDLLRQASDAYLAAHRQTGGYFSLINAATLALLSGQPDEAVQLAQAVLADAQVTAGDSFYALATAGEAYVLTGHTDRADAVLRAALKREDATLGARAATARQLALLAGHLDSPPIARLGALLRPPPVICYTGHMFRSDPAAETRILAGINAALDRDKICIAFGAAAAGADLLVAEAILARGGELNVILPFAAADFAQSSVLPFGQAWMPRFEAVLAAAATVQCVTTGAAVGDPGQFEYGNQVAMGHTCLRAQHLNARATLLTVQSSAPGRRRGGTGSAAAYWLRTGRHVETVAIGPVDRTAATPTAPAPAASKRETRSIIFTDFSGFSKLGEQHMPRFLASVMGCMAATLAERGADVLFKNTWGDALFAVVKTPAAAAELALTLGKRLAEVDLTGMGLPDGSGMRIGVHHGPVYRALDPIMAKRGFFGSEVTYAARLEPVTPVGKVYATQPFAALLALSGDRRFRCRYVGPVQLAKEYGTLPMHRLAWADGAQADGGQADGGGGAAS